MSQEKTRASIEVNEKLNALSIGVALGPKSMNQGQGLGQGQGDKETGNKRIEPSYRYTADRLVGNGSFGVVYQAVCDETSEVVAIKKVLQDKRFKNRELQITRMLNHINVINLKHCFYSHDPKVY